MMYLKNYLIAVLISICMGIKAEVDIDLDIPSRSVYFKSGYRQGEQLVDKYHAHARNIDLRVAAKSAYQKAEQRLSKIYADIKEVQDQISFAHESFASTQELSDLVEQRDRVLGEMRALKEALS